MIPNSAGIAFFIGAFRKMISLASCRKIVCSSALWAMLTGISAVASGAEEVEVSPPHVALEVMLNEPVVFQIEVKANYELGELELKADGLRIQREVKKPAPNRRVFLIEPETSTAGRVSGSISVVKEDGSALCWLPVSGEVKPHVRVSPARVFLGALEYGTTSGRIIKKSIQLSFREEWTITGVDASEISGVRYEMEDGAAGVKHFHLWISEDAFKQGAAFGAFISRAIKIRTSLPQQPEITVAVTAILSANGTKRDFKTFLFRGNERWQGIWATPNIAAAVLGPVLLFVFGSAFWCLLSGRRTPWIAGGGVLLLFPAGLGLYFLIKSYSRGGWVAFISGLLCLFWLMKGCRRYTLAAAITFTFFVFALPEGVQRVASAGAIAEDLSVRNRLLVWRGALEMIADQPWRGVGKGQFGASFEKYYQEPWHNASYSTAISDYLTIGAEGGLAPLTMLIAGLVALCAVTVRLMRKFDDLWIVAPLSSLVAISVAASFSTISLTEHVRWVFCGAVYLLVGYNAWRTFSCVKNGRGTHSVFAIWRSAGIFALIAAAATCAGVASVSVFRPLRIAGGGAENLKSTSFGVLPTKGKVLGSVLYLPESEETVRYAAKRVLRSLAHNGWRAFVVDLPIYDQKAVNILQSRIAEAKKPVVLLTERARARVALGAIKNLKEEERPSLVAVRPVVSSALSECNATEEFASLSNQVAIIDDELWVSFQGDPGKEGESLSKMLHAASKKAGQGNKAANSRGYSLQRQPSAHGLIQYEKHHFRQVFDRAHLSSRSQRALELCDE